MHHFFLLVIALFSSRALSLPPLLSPSHTLQRPLIDDTISTCDCAKTNSTGPPTEPRSICNDARLGPITLPRELPLLSFISDYDRFGGSTPGEFLAKWTNQTTGDWLWPDKNGFSLDVNGKPIVGTMVLEVGTLVDRFGSQRGRFVSAADAPFDQRSLPPSSLNPVAGGLFPYGYHVYTVKKPLEVEGGPIAPWFGQPGLGAQFNVGKIGNVEQLVKMGFLELLPMRDIRPGPGQGGGCGL